MVYAMFTQRELCFRKVYVRFTLGLRIVYATGVKFSQGLRKVYAKVYARFTRRRFRIPMHVNLA